MTVAAFLWRSVVGRHSTLQCVRRGYMAAWAGVGCLDCVRRRAPPMYVRSLCTGRVLWTEHKKQSKQKTALDKVSEIGMEITFLFVCFSLGAIFVGIFLSVLKNLLYPSSPPRIHNRTFKKCENHPEIIATFGTPLKDYARYPDWQRIQRVSAVRYKRNTVKCLRVTFYISGPKVDEATVHVDLRKNSINWNYDVRYIIVKFGTDPQRSIIVEDNRFDS